VNVEEAEAALIQWLRSPPQTMLSSYGYDLYLPTLIREHLRARNPRVGQDEERAVRQISPPFYAAAWELCRRGILRPGVREHGLQATADGSAGNGYSVTPFGREWIAESDQDDFVPTEPQRFAQMLKPHALRFGWAFQERAQEAVRCYGAHAYLACCTMCGAGAESILLAAAIAKSGEDEVLKMYNGANGRSRVQSSLLGQVPERIRHEFNNLSVLLKYWRDSAAHGRPASIKDNEAYTSLALLLRLAQFVDENWDTLTRPAA
jgi:hypothetical protein